MQISMSLLVINTFQLLLLIIAVYMIVFLKMRYHVRLSGLNAFLLTVQVVNLIVLRQYMVGYIDYKGSLVLLFIVQGVFMALLLLRFLWLLRSVMAFRRKLLMPQSIRETIDYLPGGICFSTPNGKPILTNYKMNDLIFRLTGHTIIDAQITWEELRQFHSTNEYVRLENPWLFQENLTDTTTNTAAATATDEYLFFQLPDNSIWRFHKEELSDRLETPYLQLEATEISDLYRYSKELYENNQRLAEQYKRQRNILVNIVEMNRKKEILSMKMRIHDDLGQSILTTKQHLLNKTLAENSSYLADIWTHTIRNLTDFTRIDNEEISPEVELRKAADMIGCQIEFLGDRPADRKTALLFYATVREALINAVRHANADRLKVIISPTTQGYHVEISDNGDIPATSVTEGNGLSNLRKRLEQEGAALQIRHETGVVLIAELPAERKELSPQEARQA